MLVHLRAVYKSFKQGRVGKKDRFVDGAWFNDWKVEELSLFNRPFAIC